MLILTSSFRQVGMFILPVFNIDTERNIHFNNLSNLLKNRFFLSQKIKEFPKFNFTTTNYGLELPSFSSLPLITVLNLSSGPLLTVMNTNSINLGKTFERNMCIIPVYNVDTE